MIQSRVEVVNLVAFTVSGLGLVVFNKQLAFVIVKLNRAFWGRWFFNGPCAQKIVRAMLILVGLGWAIIGSAALKALLSSN